jgi:cyclic pyranopterin phosphate synthase
MCISETTLREASMEPHLSGAPESLRDPFGRPITYLRLSVTDRCDLRCTYCLPEGFRGFEEPGHWLTLDEVERLVGAFVRLGVHKIRLTGGEPLLRRNLCELAARLGRLPGVADLSLSTNATQLRRHADALRQAGVSRINVSLDSLRPERIRAITGRDCLHDILDGLAAATAAGFSPVKVNMVVQGGVNDDEVPEMLAFCMERGFVLRLIETMPMGSTGRSASHLDLQDLKEQLRSRFGLVDGVLPGGGPARYLQSLDGAFSVGFITPLSQHFCATCNRVRLAVDGTLYPCLGQESRYGFRSLLREGVSDTGLEAAVQQAIALKPERHEFREAPRKIVRFMSATGG